MNTEVKTLTKAEAIQAMKEGKKVRHRYFSDDEWMTMDGNKFLLEDGVRCDQDQFWRDRKNYEWQNDWSIVEDTEVKEEVKLNKVDNCLYMLHEIGFRKGETIFSNKFSMSIQHDAANGVSKEEAEEFTNYVQNAVNSHASLLEVNRQLLEVVKELVDLHDIIAKVPYDSSMINKAKRIYTKYQKQKQQ